jgi:hypothetical protein
MTENKLRRDFMLARNEKRISHDAKSECISIREKPQASKGAKVAENVPISCSDCSGRFSKSILITILWKRIYAV